MASRLSPNLPKTEKKAEMIHFVLTGNPGTGKTTVEKLIGQMFYEMGYLKSGQLVEVYPTQLIGGYIGQTAMKTADYIQKAMVEYCLLMRHIHSKEAIKMVLDRKQ